MPPIHGLSKTLLNQPTLTFSRVWCHKQLAIPSCDGAQQRPIDGRAHQSNSPQQSRLCASSLLFAQTCHRVLGPQDRLRSLQNG